MATTRRSPRRSVTERLKMVVVLPLQRDEQPTEGVDQNAETAPEGEQHEGDPDQGDVDAGGLRHPTADAGQHPGLRTAPQGPLQATVVPAPSPPASAGVR